MKTLFFKESFALFVGISILLLLCIGYMTVSKNTQVTRYVLAVTTLLIMLLLMLIYFYRYPELHFKADPKTIYAASDGVVKQIIHDKKNNRIKVVAFLNIFNQHLQFYPVSGKIVGLTYHKGSFHPAYLLEKSVYNERMETVIQTDIDQVKVTQIAGQIARRIVNHSKEGTNVLQGDYMGMIKLSSRVDIEFSSDIYECKVKVGDKLRALETIVAVSNR